MNTPIDASDRPFTNGEYNLLSPKYPKRSFTFVPYLSSFFGVDTGNFYTVIPGSRTGPTTSLTTERVASSYCSRWVRWHWQFRPSVSGVYFLPISYKLAA